MRRTSYHMDDRVEYIKFWFPVWPRPEAAMGLLCNFLVGALPDTHDVIRSFPRGGVKVLHPVQMI